MYDYSKIHFQHQFLFNIGDELKQTVSIVVDLASVFDPDGVDIYFLNREPMFHVRNAEQLVPVFAVPPAGLLIKMIKYFYLFSFI